MPSLFDSYRPLTGTYDELVLPDGTLRAHAGRAVGTLDALRPEDFARYQALAELSLYNQGVTLWNAQKYAEAKVQFEAAIKADPKMAVAYYQLGMANLNLGQLPAAKEAFQGYLSAEPNGPKAAEVQGILKQLP